MVKTSLETEILCTNKIHGNCPRCTRDYSDHHPNNEDCPHYLKTTLFLIDVGNTEPAEAKFKNPCFYA